MTARTRAPSRAPRRAPASTLPVLLLVVGTSLVVGLLGTVLAGGGPEEVPPGLSDPGPVAAWGSRSARLAADLAAIATTGSLLLTVALLPGHPVGRTARAAATLWCVSAGAAWFFSVCEASGAAPSSIDAATLWHMSGTPQASVAAAVCVVSAWLALVGGRPRGCWEARGLLAAALAAAAALPVTGHVSSGAPGSSAAVTALLVHVVAAVLWAGGLLALLLHVRGDPGRLGPAAHRFSRVALGAFVALAGSGVAAAVSALGPPGPAWRSGYAGLVLAKVAVLVVLGVAGHLHRRHTLPRLDRGRPGAFASLAFAELVWMGAAAGLAVALSRTPPPAALATAADTHGPTSSPPPLSVGGLLTRWQPDVLVLTVLALALVCYLAGARSVTRGPGPSWPARRTAAFVAGLLVVLVVLCSGLATWSPVLLSVHLACVLALLLVAPTLMLLGRPLLLARRTGVLGSSSTGRLRAPSPTMVALLACALLLVSQLAPVLELSLRPQSGRLVAMVLALAVGAGVLAPLLDPVGSSPGRRDEATRSLVLPGLCLVVLAGRLLLDDGLLAGAWFLELRLAWSDPAVDQRRAGLVVAASLGWLLGVVALSRARPVVAGQEPGAQRRTGQTRPSTRPSRSSADTGP